MSIHLLHNKVLVKKDVAKEKSVGGIIIPGSVDAKSVQGVVMATGPGHLLTSGEVHKLDVQVGDRVQFRATAGAEVEVEGDKLMLLVDQEIDVVFRG